MLLEISCADKALVIHPRLLLSIMDCSKDSLISAVSAFESTRKEVARSNSMIDDVPATPDCFNEPWYDSGHTQMV